MRSKRTAGFTLIELMIVSTMIGILAAVAIPAYQDYTVRARVSEGFGLAREVQVSIAHYYDRWGVLPHDNAAAGLPAPANMGGAEVTEVSVEDGAIVLSYAGKGLPAAGRPFVLVYHPGINKDYPSGPLVWVCNEQPPPAGFYFPSTTAAKSTFASRYLPASCRV